MDAPTLAAHRWIVGLACLSLVGLQSCIFSAEPSSSSNDDHPPDSGTSVADADVGSASSDAGDGGVRWTRDAIVDELTSTRWVTVFGNTRSTTPQSGALSFVTFDSDKTLELKAAGHIVDGEWSLARSDASTGYLLTAENLERTGCAAGLDQLCGLTEGSVSDTLSNTKRIEAQLETGGGRVSGMYGTSYYVDDRGMDQTANIRLGRSDDTSVTPADLEGTWVGSIRPQKNYPKRVVDFVNPKMGNVTATVKTRKAGGGDTTKDYNGLVVTFALGPTVYWGLYSAGQVPLLSGQIEGGTSKDAILWYEFFGTSRLTPSN